MTAACDPTLVDAADVAAALRVDPERGLTQPEASRRLARDGLNELRAAPKPALWSRVVAQFRDPLVYLLLVAIVISGVAWVAEGAEGMPVEAIVIAAIVVAKAVLGFVQQARAEDAVAAVAKLTAATSTVRRGGRFESVPSAQLVRGDILVLSEGDAVGADARLLEASALRVQESSLTGESEASDKSAEPLPRAAALGDRRNMVYRGTAIVQGVGRAVVVSTGMDTEMGRIADLLDRTEAEPSPLQSEVAAVSRSLGIIVVGIAVVVMAGGHRVGQRSQHAARHGDGVAPGAVPRRRRGARGPARDPLARAGHRGARDGPTQRRHEGPAFRRDTGTRLGHLLGQDRHSDQERDDADESRDGFRRGGGHRDRRPGCPRRVCRGAQPSAVLLEAQRVLIGGSVANNAQLHLHDGEWQIQGDPTEAAFLVAAHKLGDVHAQARDFHREAEVPFSSERKRMSVLVHHILLDRRALMTKGAPDVLLPRCISVLVGESVVPLDARTSGSRWASRAPR